MSSPEKILRKHELDAIITQAVSPELMDIQYLQELQVKPFNPLVYFPKFNSSSVCDVMVSPHMFIADSYNLFFRIFCPLQCVDF